MILSTLSRTLPYPISPLNPLDPHHSRGAGLVTDRIDPGSAVEGNIHSVERGWFGIWEDDDEVSEYNPSNESSTPGSDPPDRQSSDNDEGTSSANDPESNARVKVAPADGIGRIDEPSEEIDLAQDVSDLACGIRGMKP